MSAKELKPCPFCGSSNGLYVLQEDEYGEWGVFCDMCKTSLHNENHCETRDDAVSAWNRRADRTCRAVLHRVEYQDGVVAYTCSECGEILVCFDFEQDPPNPIGYCPNCGAKVVGDDNCRRVPGSGAEAARNRVNEVAR